MRQLQTHARQGMGTELWQPSCLQTQTEQSKLSEDKTPMQEYIESKPAFCAALMEMGTLAKLCRTWTEWRDKWDLAKDWKAFMLMLDDGHWKCPICLNTYNPTNAAVHYRAFKNYDFRACQRGFYRRTARPIPSGVRSRYS